MRTVYTLLLCFISVSLTAQIKIEGIGPFKIGKTSIDIIEEIAIKDNKSIRVVDFDIESLQAASVIYEIRSNSKGQGLISLYAHKCKNTRVFLLREYTVSGIVIKDIYLTFYNGMLVSFNSEPSNELTEALTLKYGTPNLTSTSTPSRQCPVYEDKSYTQTWGSVEPQAIYYLSTSKKSDCANSYYSSFSIGFADKMLEIRACDEAIDKAAQDEIQKEKRKTLKDF